MLYQLLGLKDHLDSCHDPVITDLGWQQQAEGGGGVLLVHVTPGAQRPSGAELQQQELHVKFRNSCFYLRPAQVQELLPGCTCFPAHCSVRLVVNGQGVGSGPVATRIVERKASSGNVAAFRLHGLARQLAGRGECWLRALRGEGEVLVAEVVTQAADEVAAAGAGAAAEEAGGERQARKLKRRHEDE